MSRVIGNRVCRLSVPLAVVALAGGCSWPANTVASEPPPVTPSPSSPAFSAAASPAPSAATSSAPAAAVTCPPSGVRFEMTDGDAAMGLRVRGITLVNCGSQTYRLNGYPAVRSLDEDRAVLKVQVLHGATPIVHSDLPWDGPPKPVVLKPGQRAGSAVAWRNTYDDLREPAVTVKFFDIAPVAGRPSQILDLDSGLDLGSTGRIGVSAWSPLPE
jgi:hypothetical protein